MAAFQAVLLVALLATVVYANPLSQGLRDDDNNYINCPDKINKDSVNILSKTVIENGFPFMVKTRQVHFPEHGTSELMISCIKITDLVQDGTGGYPSVLDGGVNFDYVNMELRSRRSYGFKFLIEIFGVPKPTAKPM